MDESIAAIPEFALNPELDPEKLNEEFRKTGRLRVPHFLQPDSANALYQHLRHKVAWRTFLVASEQLMGTPPGEPVGVNPDEEKEILDCAYDGARKGGFACVYDADRLFPEDEPEYNRETAPAERPLPADPVLAAFEQFLNGPERLDFIRKLVGLEKLAGISTQATRFRGGQFMGFHEGTWSADKSLKRRASFTVHLTSDWKPEWGGGLAFRSNDKGAVESFLPCFDTFDIHAFPMGNWVDAVTPFAEVPRLSIQGRLYVP